MKIEIEGNTAKIILNHNESFDIIKKMVWEGFQIKSEYLREQITENGGFIIAELWNQGYEYKSITENYDGQYDDCRFSGFTIELEKTTEAKK
jgi:hypothetical protein